MKWLKLVVVGVFGWATGGCAARSGGAEEAPGGEARRAAMAWLEESGAIDAVDDVALMTVEGDDLGMTHVRFAQLQQGVPVAGAQVVVHLDRDLVVGSSTDALVRDLGGDG